MTVGTGSSRKGASRAKSNSAKPSNPPEVDMAMDVDISNATDNDKINPMGTIDIESPEFTNISGAWNTVYATLCNTHTGKSTKRALESATNFLINADLFEPCCLSFFDTISQQFSLLLSNSVLSLKKEYDLALTALLAEESKFDKYAFKEWYCTAISKFFTDIFNFHNQWTPVIQNIDKLSRQQPLLPRLQSLIRTKTLLFIQSITTTTTLQTPIHFPEFNFLLFVFLKSHLDTFSDLHSVYIKLKRLAPQNALVKKVEGMKLFSWSSLGSGSSQEKKGRNKQNENDRDNTDNDDDGEGVVETDGMIRKIIEACGDAVMSDDEDEDDDGDEDEDKTSSLEESIKILLFQFSSYQSFATQLATLDIIPLLLLDQCTPTPYLTELFYNEIESRIFYNEFFRSDFTRKRLLGVGLKWFVEVVLGFLNVTLSPLSTSKSANTHSLTHLQLRLKNSLTYHFFKTFCDMRIHDIFDMVIDFPDSKPALIDLRYCLNKTNMRGRLLERISEQIESRCLLPSVPTKTILELYASTIHSLKILDPSYTVLDAMTKPFKQYLLSSNASGGTSTSSNGNRSDTIRCIVEKVLDRSSGIDGDAWKELEDDADDYPVVQVGGAQQHQGDEDEEEDDDKWMPEPIQRDMEDYGKPSTDSMDDPRRKKRDVVSMFLSIYDSPDVFVKEFQMLLAERLLVVENYDTDNEIRNIETLKTRFGDAALQTCDVMLKDIQASQRMNNNIHSAIAKKLADGEDKKAVVSPLVLSRLFWPTNVMGSLNSTSDGLLASASASATTPAQPAMELPSTWKESIAEYESQFKSLKQERCLEWLLHLGTVELDLSFENAETGQDDVVSVTCSVHQGVVINKFGEKEEWSLEELHGDTKLAMPELRSALYHWLQLGYIKRIVTPVATTSSISSSQEAHAANSNTNPTYRVIKSLKEKDDDRHLDVGMDNDNGPTLDAGGTSSTADTGNATSSANQEQMEKLIALCGTYVKMYLTNLGEKTLDGAYGGLQMLLSGIVPGGNFSKDDLKGLLDYLVEVEEAVEYSGGKYKIRKK